MININEVLETNKMIEKENLDVRTITLGISLLDCIDSDLGRLNEKIYNKITSGVHWRDDRERVRNPDRQQADLCHADRSDRWICVQDFRGFRDDRQDA